MPSSWAGAAALLATAERHRPGTAAPMNTAMLAQVAKPVTRVDLSGMWAPAADRSAPGTTVELRRIDDKLRITLPLEAREPVALRAERDNAVLTVYLPDSVEAPSPGCSVAPLPLKTKGRLTLGIRLCEELGVGVGWTVLVVLDPTRRTLTICAASLVQEQLAAAMQDQRAGATPGRPAGAADSVADVATVIPLRTVG